jgi:hypothetical protein
MGSYDGAETCELVGLYILSQMQHININVGLYRDDGLAVCNKTAREIEQIKKEICRIFANNKLKITIEANKKVIEFLDITMDLTTATHKPYMKPNNTPLYVHRQSNHPPNIIKNIPESINKRLSTISSNKPVFNEACPPYQEALKKSGYSHKLEYKVPMKTSNSGNKQKKRNRKRNITWFNPPYSTNVTTNIGKQFLMLLDRCFPPSHKLHKLLNRNTVKISYRTMTNMKQIISAHNKSIIKRDNAIDTTPGCNCRKNTTCPLEGKCLTTGIIYQATVTRQDNNKDETYIGLTDNTFKTRYNGHNCSFRNREKRNSTTLSQYVWELKDNNTPYTIKWKVIARSSAYSPSTKKCNLCLTEKYFIICKPQIATLNNRNELASDCRHKRRHLLCNM